MQIDNPNEIPDGWLVEKYQSGHKNALALLVKRWHLKFCKQAFWYVKDIDTAKDIAQDSWKVIINKIDSLQDSNKFGGWALSIINRKSIDWIRKQKRTKKNLKDFDQTYGLLNDIEDATEDNKSKTILDAVSLLPENQKVVLRMFYLESYSIIQISELLKISKGTVKSRLFYAREKLKSHIKI